MATGTNMAENSGESSSKNLDSAGKHARYTIDQIAALERVYLECPKPSVSRRQQLAKEYPVLANIELKQIKIWFQNRRCREKQKFEMERLQSVNLKLTAVNKMLSEENNRLSKQVSHLAVETCHLKLRLQSPTETADNGSQESVSATPEHSMEENTSFARLLTIAEETLGEFLSKATGTAVNWVQMPGMKPGPNSVGIYVIPQSNGEVAARACGLVGLEPPKIVEILKNRPSWFRGCRSQEIFTSFPTANGGTIELIYTQMFAPAFYAPARDLWTLRYTTLLGNGSLAVCERSLSGSGSTPNTDDDFARAEMLPSGYLIRSCDGGGSVIYIVDHLRLESSSAPEVLKPLYTSSRLIAEKMTMAALRYVRQIAHETSSETSFEFRRHPSVLRKFSQKLSRSFNDGVSGFSDAGWLEINNDDVEVVTIAVNSTKNIMSPNTAANSSTMSLGVLCAKASMYICNVPPVVLIRFLREHRAEWADHNIDAYSAASLKTNSSVFSERQSSIFSPNQSILPLGHTIGNEETLEIVRIEGRACSPENTSISKDVYLLQMFNGVDEKSSETCAELVFSPVIEGLPDDVPLLSSGFRIVQVMSESSVVQEVDPASSQNQHDMPPKTMRAVLTIAFQFPFESKFQKSVASMASQYVSRVIEYIHKIYLVIAPPEIPKFSPEKFTLAQWISNSYRYHFGENLTRAESLAGPIVMRYLWHYPDAILCCSIKAPQTLIFANQAGLNMLETTLEGLKDTSLNNVFDDSGCSSLCSEFPKIMLRGFGRLPSGVCKSITGCHITYSHSNAWKVLAGEANKVHCLALSFINWSFV